jgi:Flp pilus assembly protein CpaB
MVAVLPRLRAILLVILALMAGVAAYAFADQHLHAISSSAPPVGVLIATRDIQVAELITPAMITVTEVPADAVPGPSAALEADLNTVLGSRAREPIYAGEVVQKVRLFAPGLAINSAPEEALVKRGMALYTVATTQLNMPLSGLEPGDHVAVVATLLGAPVLPNSDGGGSLRTSQVVVQTIDPSALVTFVEPPSAGGTGALTLAVPRSEVKTLALLNRLGALSFAQVRPDDPTAPLDSTNAQIFIKTYHVPTR